MLREMSGEKSWFNLNKTNILTELLTFSESEQLTEEETPLISVAMVETLLEAGLWSTSVMTARCELLMFVLTLSVSGTDVLKIY